MSNRPCPSFANGEFSNNNIQRSFAELNRTDGYSDIATYGKNNYIKTFQPNKPLLDKINYGNKEEILHNNVGANTLGENIVEYRINIDSYDRNINTYPNPFDFVVKFTNGDIKEDTATINLTLNNVQYIRIETVILPTFIVTKCSNNKHCNISKKENIKICNEYHRKSLLDDRFIIMEIEELESEQIQTFSTADNRNYYPRGAYCTVVPDTKMGLWYSGVCFNGNKLYKRSNLQKIKQLTIKFYDSYGKLLNYQNLSTDKEHLDNCNSQLCHPKNRDIQVYITMIVGTVVPSITTMPSWPK